MEIVEPKCKVCSSPHRREIDMMLATGWSNVAVMNHFNQIAGEGFFNKHNIGRHKSRHLSTRDAAVRRIIEERARQFGVDVDNVEGFIVTKAAVLDTIIQSGMEGIHRGDTFVEPKDVLTAVQQLDKFESEWKETAIDEIMSEFKAFTEAVKEIVGEEQYEAIFTAFERRLESRNSAVLKPLQIPEVTGEVTEEVFED